MSDSFIQLTFIKNYFLLYHSSNVNVFQRIQTVLDAVVKFHITGSNVHTVPTIPCGQLTSRGIQLSAEAKYTDPSQIISCFVHYIVIINPSDEGRGLQSLVKLG
jgi:hypothetical protein